MIDFLRHTLATLAYRGGKAIRDAPEDFGKFRMGADSKTAGEILAHIGDLLDWALSQAEGREVWREADASDWEGLVARFHQALARFDAYLEGAESIEAPAERIFQGPIADALTHVGQLAMMRRLAGSPIRGENFFRARIEVGQVGPNQSRPRREFD